MSVLYRPLRARGSHVHTFITSWPKVTENANLLKKQLTPYSGTITMLDNPNCYFTEQWDAMLAQFVGDIVLWVMGDVTLPEDPSGMISAMHSWLRQPTIGVYGPDIDYTFHRWETQDFKQYSSNVYAVPCGEPNFWAINRKVISSLRPINPLDNYIGWGIDLQVSATAEFLGLDTVRDYSFLVKHPKGTAYDGDLAEAQMSAWLDLLNPTMRDCMLRRWDEGLKYNLIYRDFQTQRKNEDHSSDNHDLHTDVP